MAVDQETSASDEQPEGDSDPGDHGVPLRQTLGGEIDGLFRFAAARLGGRSESAADAVQQAILLAIAHPSPPTDASSQRAWLRGILRNVIRRTIRSRRRQRQAVTNAAIAMSASQTHVDDVSAAGDSESRSHLVQAIYLEVTSLSQADQDLFYAFYRCGKAHACIAAELGTTPKAVEARLYRLRSRLRDALNSAGVVLP